MGNIVEGPTSRQGGEPTTSYVDVHLRCWALVHQLGQSISLSDSWRASSLLDRPMLSQTQTLMALTHSRWKQDELRRCRSHPRAARRDHQRFRHKGGDAPKGKGYRWSPWCSML